MAVDSIIARPTNKVRVMVAEASGCWASELSAVATALPSASAGPMHPKPVVMPAMTIDATAIIVMLSIASPLAVVVHASMFCVRFRLGCGVGTRLRLRFEFWLGLADARGGRDVNRG